MTEQNREYTVMVTSASGMHRETVNVSLDEAGKKSLESVINAVEYMSDLDIAILPGWI